MSQSGIGSATRVFVEIDREIINDLFLASTGTAATWDRAVPGGMSELDHIRKFPVFQDVIEHEMGHAIGMGHPCLVATSACDGSCSAVMAASSITAAKNQPCSTNGQTSVGETTVICGADAARLAWF